MTTSTTTSRSDLRRGDPVRVRLVYPTTRAGLVQAVTETRVRVWIASSNEVVTVPPGNVETV